MAMITTLYSTEHIADMIKRGSNYISETASVLFMDRADTDQFIAEYEEKILNQEIYSYPERPVFETWPDKELGRLSISSHPPGSVLALAWIYDLNLVLQPELDELDKFSSRFYDMCIIMIAVAGLMIPATYLIARRFGSSQAASVGAGFLALGIAITYCYPSFSDPAVAGLVAMSVYLILKAKDHPLWSLLAGLFASLALFITFGPLIILGLSFLVISIFYIKDIKKFFLNGFLFILPIVYMLIWHSFKGYNYFNGMLLGMRNIDQDYNSGKLYHISAIINSERMELGIGLISVLFLVAALIYITKNYIPRKLLFIGIMISIITVGLFLTPLVLTLTDPLPKWYGVWVYGLPFLITFLAFLLKMVYPKVKEKITPAMIFYVAILSVTVLMILSGRARGEMDRTNMFVYPLMIGSAAFILDKTFKKGFWPIILASILVGSVITILLVLNQNTCYHFLKY